MTLEKYQQVIKPGTKVYVMYKGTKLSGVAGNLLNGDQVEPIVRFDDGTMVYVTEKCVHLFQLEPLN